MYKWLHRRNKRKKYHIVNQLQNPVETLEKEAKSILQIKTITFINILHIIYMYVFPNYIIGWIWFIFKFVALISSHKAKNVQMAPIIGN